MQPSTFAEQDQIDEKPSGQIGPSVSTLQVIAGVAAAACLVLMLADMAASASFVPVQLRILALGAALGSFVQYKVKWADERSERRHQEAMTAVRERNKDVEFIEGYMAGLRRQVPPDARI